MMSRRFKRISMFLLYYAYLRFGITNLGYNIGIEMWPIYSDSYLLSTSLWM